MTVNYVNLSVSFRGVNGLNSLKKKGEELSLREEVVFSFVKNPILEDFRRLLYTQGAEMLDFRRLLYS